ncbi:MAG TPA: anti-sigma factor [Nocardioidaceae bacterium]|nr:anti-sigma factor [Nocardioidaceae bacterium]
MNIDVHTLAGAFALDALPSDEAAEFQRHLAECTACQVEVAELQTTATHLGLAVAEQPPPRVREAVLQAVHQTRQVPPPAQPTHRRRRPPRAWLAAAAAAVVVGAGAVGLTDLVRDDAAPRDPIASVVAAPDAESTAARLRGGGRLTVVSSEQLGQAVVLSERLPPAGAGRVYQLWLVDSDGQPRSADVLIGSSGAADVVSGVEPGDQVAITREPEGGSEQPTMKPLAVTKAL